MILIRRSDAPAGGWFYDLPNGFRVWGTGLENLVDRVESRMIGYSMPIPEYLAELVEDTICQRQPPDRCRYKKKLGDMLSAGIHTMAAAVDRVAGTKLQAKARRCGKCGSRRVALNNIV